MRGERWRRGRNRTQSHHKHIGKKGIQMNHVFIVNAPNTMNARKKAHHMTDINERREGRNRENRKKRKTRKTWKEE